MKLYRRLQFEKQTMSEEGTPHNEMLLYHTSSASVEAICGEGLDQRLSRKGRFGNGVYFRFIPTKRQTPVYCGNLQGNVTDQNEFIIYTHYRAMPAYVVEYTVP
ncbi:hypothetical protein GBAR_LOCUS13385 [Geodia barretti]|uniref:PARP catalytic domain-containing protein n=1 Tax=Geodia barretti TaxID=519541 RepID=A0AA35WJN6_GEOBA|nr:hypothetical protein GBAR_LOCUS13385 [Geodia barretti]